MSFLILLIKGFLIGIAFIIPGVSGGTLAMYLGVYQELLDSIGNILKDFKKSVKFLFPIFLGIGISIVALAKLLSLLLNWNSFIILFFFIGLIIGGIKHIYKKSQAEKITISMAVAFIISFGLLLALVILGKASPDNGIDYFTFNFWTYLLLIGLGALASITMIVPGISGSAVLLVLGFYTAIVSNVVGNIFDFTSIWYNIQVIVPFALGALIGIVIFSKLLGEALRKFPKETYFAILGFIIMSAIGVFLEIKDPTTAAEFSDQLPIYENLIIFIGDHIWSVVGGIIAFVGGYIGSIYMTKLDKEVNRQ
jgi:putative membrane protein